MAISFRLRAAVNAGASNPAFAVGQLATVTVLRWRAVPVLVCSLRRASYAPTPAAIEHGADQLKPR
jgi:hypothetical protein